MSFSDWWTNANNPSLPKDVYLYDARHIGVLIAVAVACVVLALVFYKKSDRAKRILLNVFAGILLGFEIVSRVVNLIIAESLDIATIGEILLPMHICSVMVWVFIIGIFSKNKTLINFGAIGGLVATVAFLLYPAVGLNRVYMSFTCCYSTISHSIGFITAVLLIVFGFAKFDIKDIWKTYVCFACMFAWGAFVNFVIFPGSDYMYMINDPLELNLGGFPYQVLYLIILAVYVLIFYITPILYRKLKNKKKQ